MNILYSGSGMDKIRPVGRIWL